ncbi:MAG TPA: hypothetical protein VGI39_07585 [Polyangiaceae bacterium]
MKSTFHWQPPVFEPLRMDAEIGSYQEDYDPLFVRAAPKVSEAAPGEVRCEEVRAA